MNYILSGKRTIEIERDAVDALLERIDETFNRACETMLADIVKNTNGEGSLLDLY